jgi:hypothetical protein
MEMKNIMRTISRNVKKLSKGKSAVVVVPISVWQNITRMFEEYEEYLEMSSSESYSADIKASRASNKELSLADAMRKFHVA